MSCGSGRLEVQRSSSRTVAPSSRRAEQCGLLQIVSDASSPWQNGRAERHGGWAKDKVEEELQAGVLHVSNEEEMDLLVSAVVSNKNRYFHRGGFSPAQLVFGCNPRVPLELLGDDELSVVAKEDVMADPLSKIHQQQSSLELTPSDKEPRNYA